MIGTAEYDINPTAQNFFTDVARPTLLLAAGPRVEALPVETGSLVVGALVAPSCKMDFKLKTWAGQGYSYLEKMGNVNLTHVKN